MIYWVTNSGTSSARLYYETRHVDGRLQPPFFGSFMPPRGRVTVPTGCGSLPSQFDNRGFTINRDPAVARKNAESRSPWTDSEGKTSLLINQGNRI